jgi:ABC-type sugar transport system ATPase subunit
MTVYNNLNFPLKQRRLPDREILERVKDMANRVGIPDSLFKRLPDQLSEGQKQMVAIGRSLMTRPKLLLLDEALVHLDPITKLKVRDEILDLQEEFQMTILMVTHQLTDALALADRIGVLYGGRIIQVATPDRLLNEPENDYVRAYIEASRLLPERRRRRS